MRYIHIPTVFVKKLFVSGATLFAATVLVKAVFASVRFLGLLWKLEPRRISLAGIHLKVQYIYMAGNRLIRPLQELQMASSCKWGSSLYTRTLTLENAIDSWKSDQGVPANLTFLWNKLLEMRSSTMDLLKWIEMKHFP